MTLYVPGSQSPENTAFADRARAEFMRVLDLEPNNLPAMESLASLAYQEAQAMPTRDQKLRKLDEARDWDLKDLAINPGNKQAYYSLGVIDWLKWYPALVSARAALGMRPEDPGPLRDSGVRENLRAQYGQVIEDGISNLQKALEIDPMYDDAMAYMNLLIRGRADLRDNQADYQADIQSANAWVEKALETKKEKAAGGATTAMRQGGFHSNVAPPPPPPPPPAGTGGSSSSTPQRIRVGGNVESANLVRKVEPVYPPLAKQARVQGTVRFMVIIGKDGQVLNIQLISGHPLLVAAAEEAVKQWVYKPTLLNGQPVEVVTTVDVNFTLSE
jgi:TonB family protein